jgi:hypothetical protein
MGTGGTFSRINRPRNEVINTPYNAEVKNVLTAYCFIKQQENLTFILVFAIIFTSGRSGQYIYTYIFSHCLLPEYGNIGIYATGLCLQNCHVPVSDAV